MAELHLYFRNRATGSFGTGRVARIAEWGTQSWKRFTIMLISLLIVSAALLAQLPVAQKAILVAAAPLMATMGWYMVLLAILVASTFGRYGRFLSLFLVIYFFLFSRLVAQPAPSIDLSLDGRK